MEAGKEDTDSTLVSVVDENTLYEEETNRITNALHKEIGQASLQRKQFGDVFATEWYTVQLVEAREVNVGQVVPNKEQFLQIELDIANHGDEPISFSKLGHFFLFVDGSLQELVILDPVELLTIDILPGEVVTAGLTFDTSRTESYSFLMYDAKRSEQAIWTVKQEEIVAHIE